MPKAICKNKIITTQIFDFISPLNKQLYIWYEQIKWENNPSKKNSDKKFGKKIRTKNSDKKHNKITPISWIYKIVKLKKC